MGLDYKRKPAYIVIDKGTYDGYWPMFFYSHAEFNDWMSDNSGKEDCMVIVVSEAYRVKEKVDVTYYLEEIE